MLALLNGSKLTMPTKHLVWYLAHSDSSRNGSCYVATLIVIIIAFLFVIAIY